MSTSVPVDAPREYALMVTAEDGARPVFVPARDAGHAAAMAAGRYGGLSSWTVWRPVVPWFYVGSDVTVTVGAARA